MQTLNLFCELSGYLNSFLNMVYFTIRVTVNKLVQNWTFSSILKFDLVL